MPVNRNSANKVIIVGYSQEAIDLVEATMNRSGMQKACASSRDGLYPSDLTKLLCDDHGIRSCELAMNPEDVRQIEPAAMWNSVLLDLAIGNSEHTLWGWPDRQAIVLVDFWLKHDSRASIIFVYDNPTSLVNHGVSKVEDEEVRHELRNWAAYNTEMLRVFSKHKDRCLMVNISRLQAIPRTFQQKHNIVFDLWRAESDALPRGRDFLVGMFGMGHEKFNFYTCAAKNYLVASYIRESSGDEYLYQRLQSVADLPEEIDHLSQGDCKTTWESLITSPKLLALSYCSIYAALRDYQESCRLKSTQNEDLFLQLQQSRGEIEERRVESRRVVRQAILEERVAVKMRVRQEIRYRLGDTLISCSRSLGGWFKMPYALIAEIRKPIGKTAKLPKAVSKAKNFSMRGKEKHAIKQQLSYRLGSILVEHARSPKGWITLPFALLGETIAFKRRRRLQTTSKKR